MISRREVIEKLNHYRPCNDCNTPIFKNKPLNELELVNRKRKCVCGKVQIDDVMIDILNVMMDFGEIEKNTDSICLKDAGTPLIEIGYPLKYLPSLLENELIIMNNVSRKCAEEIIKIPEVKGVISKQSRDNFEISDNSNEVNELLAGNDFRCDVFILKSISNCVMVCKNQSKVHIEFPRLFNPKIAKVDSLNLKEKVVLDGFCGSGTLGMAALKKGAEKVIFSDINKNALDDVIYNLKLNFGDDVFDKVEIIHSDFLELDVTCDVCFIDLFPHMNAINFIEKAKKISKQVVII
ncbi:RNA methyltransferase related protein [Methanococcus vannielii SB]|uniref:RNA methyltransferase related protein n=1 Tax=Methanococcus vannielii (strain ATCC 35089 / DSM 1224 / JCM 13029 / OCM 148 / SB) TaxID=406327 RepID=A6UP01_METVS|nr:RsmD family RNA methyltransferase [Methanococcus vannielii]ABR54223.1 RNA methyltransferase related protein [Methanococcus vannielii SB]